MVIVPFYAGLLALWYLLLSVRVVLGRRAHQVSLGEGADAVLRPRVRGHGNFAEYVPLILLLLAMLELSHTSIYVLHTLGIALLVARLLHGYALSFAGDWMPGRALGALLTFVVLALAGLLCLIQGLRGMLLLAA